MPSNIQKKRKNMTILRILSCALTVAATFLANAQGMHGAEQALTFFEELNNKWEDILMPLARRQAARDLRRLSNELDTLALDKQEFTESLLAYAKALERRGGMDYAYVKRVNKSVNSFKSTTKRLRRSLKSFISNLPSDYQEEGMKFYQTLFLGFGQKWQDLDNTTYHLTGSKTFSADKIRAESKDLVRNVQRLKALTDELIAKIEGSEPPH